ncbi:MAG TPA: hypothetical protein PK819_07410 [Thermomicrobiales bacterium]|nr:hypothetical protein [Thermomicrobiales bacterium]
MQRFQHLSLVAVLLTVLVQVATQPIQASASWSAWTKTPTAIFEGQYIASDPTLIDMGDHLRMFYTCFVLPPEGFVPEKVRAAICAADSTDGLTWTEIDTDPDTHGLVLRGREGSWEENLEANFVLKRGDTWYLYYSGYEHIGDPALGFPAALSVATSTDGETFTRVSDQPILEPTPGGYDNDAIYSPAILDIDGTMTMIYAGHCYTKCDKGYGNVLLSATSTDGIAWTKDAEPTLVGNLPDAEWTADGVAEPALLAGPDGFYYLFFTGLQGDGRLLGEAVGPTPTGPWTINPEPLFLPEEDGFDTGGILAPFVALDGDTVQMWFLGQTTADKQSIGFAEASWPLFTGE